MAGERTVAAGEKHGLSREIIEGKGKIPDYKGGEYLFLNQDINFVSLVIVKFDNFNRS